MDKRMSEIVRSVINPETNWVSLRTYPGGGIELIFLIAGSIYCSIVVDPAELSDATWREFFKANPEITPALAKAKGKPIEELVMLAHCAGLDVKATGDNGLDEELYEHYDHQWLCGKGFYDSSTSFDLEIAYEKITVSLPEPEPTEADSKPNTCAEFWQGEAIKYQKEAEALKATLATVQAAVGDVLGIQEGVSGE